MQVLLVDGTWELFRHFYGRRPGHLDPAGVEVGAVRGVVGSVLAMLESGATHVGVATDHVIESFRNDLWPGYKTGEGVDPVLAAQFPLMEDALGALGVVVWPMVEMEADDALASAARVAAGDARVDRVVIATPDKDLAQCVGGKVVQWDRKTDTTLDASAVREKYGVAPGSIPDWLALTGDSADGFPGLPGFGAKTSAALLARFGHVGSIPTDPSEWPGTVRGAPRLAATLAGRRDLATLFVTLATLRTDASVGEDPEAWRWRGPRRDFPNWCERLGSPRIAERAARRWREAGDGP